MTEAIWQGLIHLLSFHNLALIVAGNIAGMVIGALPGLTATMAVALLVPFTFSMDPVGGLVLLGSIYMGAIYGGCFSAIHASHSPGSACVSTCASRPGSEAWPLA